MVRDLPDAKQGLTAYRRGEGQWLRVDWVLRRHTAFALSVP